MNWTRQPPTFTGFNRRYPKPGFCYLPTALPYGDLVRGLIGVPGSTEIRRPTSRGVGYHSIRQTNGGLNFGNILAINAETFTILQVANPASAAQYGNGFSQRAFPDPNTHVAIYWNTDVNVAAVAGKFACLMSVGAVNIGVAGTTGTPVDGAFHAWGVTRDGSSGRPVLWVDGAKPAQTSSGAGGTFLQSSAQTRLGNPGLYTTDSALATTADHALCVCWDSVLPDALMAELGRNPWQLFAPLPARVYSFPSAFPRFFAQVIG